jgi:hypothetical protein
VEAEGQEVPGGREGGLAVADRHAAWPTVAMGDEMPAFLDPLLVDRRLDPGEPVVERWLR